MPPPPQHPRHDAERASVPNRLALLTSSLSARGRAGPPEPVEVVGEAKQDRLQALGGEGAPRRAGGELALGRGEDALDERALSVQRGGEGALHLAAHAAPHPGGLATLRGDHTERPNGLADVAV